MHISIIIKQLKFIEQGYKNIFIRGVWAGFVSGNPAYKEIKGYQWKSYFVDHFFHFSTADAIFLNSLTIKNMLVSPPDIEPVTSSMWVGSDSDDLPGWPFC